MMMLSVFIVSLCLVQSAGRIIKQAAHHRHVGSSDSLHMSRVGLVL